MDNREGFGYPAVNKHNRCDLQCEAAMNKTTTPILDWHTMEKAL